MKASCEIEAEIRTENGKGAARAVRREGKIPAIIYSKKQKPVSVALPNNVVSKKYYSGGFMSSVVEIKADKQSFFAIPREMQFHPVKEKILHIDFLAVNEKEKVKVEIPVRYLNKERSRGLKRGGALNVVRYSVALLCDVAHIPSHLEVDLSKVNIGDSVHFSDITIPEGCEPAIQDRDFTMAAIVGRGQKAEEEEAAPAEGEESVEVPASTAKKPE